LREKLVVDWDGTVTEVDGLHLVLLEFGDVGVYERAEEELGRTLTLHEVIALEFETIHAPLAEVVDWVRENVSIRAGFAELVAAYRPLVVSSGFHELIQPVLQREGIDVEVEANRLDPRPEGWRAVFRPQRVCDICGQQCKRADVAGIGPFVYVGDGFSDRCVAEAATRVFARDGLADYLAARGVPFEPFGDFYDVARVLDAGGPVVPATRSRGRNT
jgi:2-hydroxy-3-keto-5-methylthiopentenyl-1-phosphate phosphatase